MSWVKFLQSPLRILFWFLIIVLMTGFYSLSLFIMESCHYLGKPFPFWVLPFLPAFLVGRLMHRPGRALLAGAVIPIAASLAVYLLLFVRRSGAMRLRSWIIDLWPEVLVLVVLVLGTTWIGRRLRTAKKALRRWATAAACTFLVLAAVFQVYLFLSGFIHIAFYKLDLRNIPYDQAVVALGDFFRKHYNYLEYKGVDWDKAVNEAAEKSRQAQTEAEYFQIVSGLLNTLGDGHLRVRRSPSEKPERRDVDLGVRWIKLENRWFVKDVTDGSPAAKAGLKRGEELLAQDGRTPGDLIASAPDWRFNSKFGTVKGDRVGERARLAYMLQRPEGSVASLNLDEPVGGRRRVEVRYEKWDWPRTPYFNSHRLPGDTGYVRIGRFVSDYVALIHSFDRALEGLWDTRGLIIDVRSNPGGFGFITDVILDRFCRERIYYGRLRGSGKRYSKLYLMPRRPLYLKPVAVLIDEFDFSASELFAFAGSAVPGVLLIGRPTGGVVSCPSQQKIYLPAGLSLEFTFGTLTDEKGTFVVEWTGVQPDLAVPQTIDDLRMGRDRDLEVAVQIFKNK